MCIAKPVRLAVSLLLFLSCLCSSSLCYGEHIHSHYRNQSSGNCHANERKALLQFKQGVHHGGMLSSWTGYNCCEWRGVSCHKFTGNVFKLDLHCKEPFWSDSCLRGEFGSSLLNLEYLEHLDVAANDFMGSRIPDSIDSLTKLKHLDLSWANFSGSVPRRLGRLTSLLYLNLSSDRRPLVIDNGLWLSNLSALNYLDLYGMDLFRFVPIALGNLTSLRYLDISWTYNCIVQSYEWISRLIYLRQLHMSFCELKDNTPSILQALNMLPSISEVYLARGDMKTFPSLDGHINFTFLSTLDFSQNYVISIPRWLANITSLQHLIFSWNSMKGGILSFLESLCNLKTLDASLNNFDEKISTSNANISHCSNYQLETLNFASNNFTGLLPVWLGKFQKLKRLHLNDNNFSGPIPEFLGSLTFLQELRLSRNKLNGKIPSTVLLHLKELTVFDVAANNLRGTLSELHFSNLKILTELDLSSNLFELNLSASWAPPFRLESLNLKSCKMGPNFPLWLQTQDTLIQFSIANAGISDVLPTWIWDFSNGLNTVNLADNKLYGVVPNQLSLVSSLSYVNLSSNGFEGLLPHFHSQHLWLLDLSNNSFSGPMWQIKSWPMAPSMNFFSVASNNLIGIIPLNICKWRSLSILDISKNHLSGVLPDCLKRLRVLNAAGNHINGNGFMSTTTLCDLRSLHLNNNDLYGSFPLAVQSCKLIWVLDLGENKINGVIPDWLPNSFPDLRILCLRGNLISGNIPSNLPHMSSLQVIDLANNYLIGNIPKNFGNFSSMKNFHNLDDESFLIEAIDSRIFDYSFFDFIVLEIKKQKMVFNHLLPLVMSIDLSRNMLSSNIPIDLGNLRGLINLDLSQNCLTGSIPKEFSKLQRLESLDLSKNKISGEIPTSLSTLTFLSYLNFSFNNLSGIIPATKQFLTFTDETSYMGNPYLCGFPLEQCEQASNRTFVIDVEKQDEKQHKNKYGTYETRWLMNGAVFGFILGFWIFYGSLILDKSWRYTYHELLQAWGDQLYMMTQLTLHQLRRIYRNE